MSTKVFSSSLQAKINALKENETLKINSGIYQGPIILKTKGIKLIGEKNTIIENNNVGSVVEIHADDIEIKNIKITRSGFSYTELDAGIKIKDSNNIVIENNEIVDCLFGIDAQGGENLLIQNNFISSKNLDIGLRGDAMRLFNIKKSKVLKNSWSHSRDVVAWYSEDILFKDNRGENSRYSLHSMYSKFLKIRNNKFTKNRVGIFLMYGNDFQITNNIIESSLGATGMGIGLKESSNIFAQNNKITYSTTGILVDNSPFNRDTKNWFFNNDLSFNNTAVTISNDREGGYFKNNNFIGNLVDVGSEGRKESRSIWEGNYFDKYVGFDENKDKIGDTPHIIKRYADTMIGSHPKTAFFNYSPITLLIGAIERMTQIGDPITILKDKKPKLIRSKND